MKANSWLCRWLPGWFRPSWDECTLASCWDGPGAERRMMNMLSPYFSQGKFEEYLKWQISRGANTVHLFLCNHKDGEGGGYSIYGQTMFGPLDKKWIKLAKTRIIQCRRAGMAVVLWGMADDDIGWNDALLKDPERYGKDLLKSGLLKYASTFVLALEMTEERVPTAAWMLYRDAVRKGFGRPVGVHHNSYRIDFTGIADILFYQIQPGANRDRVKNECAKAKSTGKPVNFFELARNPARELCEAALDAGAFGVGNW
jgi:hypothetical protein